MKTTNILIITGIVVVLTILFFFIGGDSQSILSSGDDNLELPYTCDAPTDCVDKMVNDGVGSRADLEIENIQCLSNDCVLVATK